MLCRQHVSDEEFLVLWEMGAIHSTKIFNRSDREKWSTSKGGPVFSKLFRLDRTDPLSFGPKFPEILVEWIAPLDKLGEVRHFVSLGAELFEAGELSITFPR